MDPTAPNNNNGQNPQTPVQPGQFVVAGEDMQPQAAVPSSPAQPTVSLAGERAPDAAPQTPMAAASGAAQPDPTPFSPTPPGTPQAAVPANAPSGGGGGAKKILVLLAVLVLIGIIGAVAYFFALPMINKNSQETVTDQIIEETSPPPGRTETDPTFGEIPESTTSTETVPATDLPTGGETVVDPLAPPPAQ